MKNFILMLIVGIFMISASAFTSTVVANKKITYVVGFKIGGSNVIAKTKALTPCEQERQYELQRIYRILLIDNLTKRKCPVATTNRQKMRMLYRTLSV